MKKLNLFLMALILLFTGFGIYYHIKDNTQFGLMCGIISLILVDINFNITFFDIIIEKITKLENKNKEKGDK